MKKITQVTLAALMLSFGLGSTMVYAEEIATLGAEALGVDALGKPGPGPMPDKWDNCTSYGCHTDIKIKLNVPKKCTITDPKDIYLGLDGKEEYSSFTVKSNTYYKMHISTENANTSDHTYLVNDYGDKIYTEIKTTHTGSEGPSTLSWGDNKYHGLTPDIFTVHVKTKSKVDPLSKAGDYVDTFKAKVWY